MTDGEKRRRERDRTRHNDRPFPTSRKTRWELRNIIAWDGEGANTEGGHHFYNLLAHSGKQYLFGGNRELGTKECLDFFLSHNPHSAIHVIFGGSYDVNMILKDMDEVTLEKLWRTGTCHWQEYRISYTPRKRFSCSRLKWNPKSGRFKSDPSRTFTLWDVFGFFQCSFVDACKQWKVLSDLEADAMQVMKWGRSTFTVDKAEDIIHYNAKECETLVKLVTKLFEAMDEAGISLERYDGAGSIATSLFKKHRVYDYAGDRSDFLGVPYGPVYRAAQDSYSGAHIEAPQVGNYEGEVFRYDLNSAYPASCLNLPSYAGAIWKREKEWNESPHSIVYVSFHTKKKAPFFPLWWRGSVGQYRGEILYPSNCEGAYHGWEIQNLRQYWQEGVDYDIRYALNVYLKDLTHPFTWLRGTYDIRQRFKQAGSMAQHAFKLGMNSIYGKLAQQEGYSIGTKGARFPGTHHLLWAGSITSQTRAILYRAAMEAPDNIIAFATDAVFSTKRLRLGSLGKGLGEWSEDTFAGITIVQPGVYWLKHKADCDCEDCAEGQDKWHAKYRGFDPGSLDRDSLIERWGSVGSPATNQVCSEHGVSNHHTASLTRFCTMGSALARKDLHSVWRKWITSPRCLTLTPTGKRRRDLRTKWNPAERLVKTLPTINIEGGQSMPYPVRWINGEQGIRPEEDSIEMRLLEQEYEDSFE